MNFGRHSKCILKGQLFPIFLFYLICSKFVPPLTPNTTPNTLEVASRVLANAVRKSETIEKYDGGGVDFSTRIPTKKKWDVCIVGAGLSGSVIAERYASVLGKTSLVMESRTHIVRT